MRRFLLGSVLVHAGLAACALGWTWHPGRRVAEAPATIEVLFGDNADARGTKVKPAPPLQPAPGARSAASDDILVGPPASQGGEASGQEAGLPVRLGEGEVGLRLDAPPDANMIEAQADPGNRAPKYPDTASMQRQQGRVVLRLHIDTGGLVSEVELLESSGVAALDRAAREALGRWRFIPALRDGVAVPSSRDQATNFVLE